MTISIRTRRTQLTLLALACGVLAASPARAQTQAQHRSAAPSVDNLSAQEREMLAIATDVSRRCAATLERWIASKETTEDKLFSALYYPIPKTNPPKYTTDWDVLSDRDILPIEESAMTRSPAILFVLMVDRNGYQPTHIRRYSQPLTGNRAVDLVNSRSKAMNIHQTALAASRNEAPFLFQRFFRDTGEVLMDVSVPMFVQGKHWGTVRISYRPTDGA